MLSSLKTYSFTMSLQESFQAHLFLMDRRLRNSLGKLWTLLCLMQVYLSMILKSLFPMLLHAMVLFMPLTLFLCHRLLLVPNACSPLVRHRQSFKADWAGKLRLAAPRRGWQVVSLVLHQDVPRKRPKHSHPILFVLVLMVSYPYPRP